MECRDGSMESVERMKVVILAGGMGTRISEESVIKPKPMIEIGEKPILWHIMKWYASFGFQEFIVCCGYKGHMIKEYFIHYCSRQEEHSKEPWKITLADTGLKTKTAGRILKVREYVGNEPFMLTYGDGVADVNLPELLRCHKEKGRIATITTTQPEGRFGALQIEGDGAVRHFKEKARKDQSWVNMGFMVMEPQVFDYLGDGSEMLEDSPFERLAGEGQMNAYRHNGFWSPMDTMHDKAYLENLWIQGKAPWKVEEDKL